jgi:multidrug efflux pump subunit AcrA (membrane-fusion protein)
VKKNFVRMVLLISLLLMGCDSKEQAIPETPAIPLFKQGKGVLFCAQTRDLFGLETAELAEKTFESQIEKTAQVYRSSDGNGAEAIVLLSPDEASLLTVGQPVRLEFSEAKSREFNGELKSLNETARDLFGQVEAVVTIDNSEQRYPLGTFLTAIFPSGKPRTASAIPESALLRAADGAYAYTVNGEHLSRARVKTGTISEGFVEIQDGLYPGDQVVTKGIDRLWLVELSALKGGAPCCPAPKK